MEPEPKSMLMKKDLLYQKLKDAISKGEYSIGHRFLPESDFAKDLGVARNTLRSVFNLLESENMIKRIKHKGTFVIFQKEIKAQKRFLLIYEPHQDLSWPYHYIVPGIERTAALMGIDIETCFVKNIQDSEPAYVNAIIKQRKITGIIFISNYFLGNEKILRALKNLDVPVLLTHGLQEDYQLTGWATTTYDVRSAWKMALDHLADAGHRRIVTFHMKSCAGKIRGYEYEEYRKLLQAAGVDSSPDLICGVEYIETEIKSCLERIFRHSSQPRPTAILCFSDFFASVVYGILKPMNIRIPEDVAVMGFCGALDGEYLDPPLSTVDLGYLNIGKKAVEVLNSHEDWFQPASSIKIAPPLIFTPYQLKIRESTNIKRIESKYTNSWRDNR